MAGASSKLSGWRVLPVGWSPGLSRSWFCEPWDQRLNESLTSVGLIAWGRGNGIRWEWNPRDPREPVGTCLRLVELAVRLRW